MILIVTIDMNGMVDGIAMQTEATETVSGLKHIDFRAGNAAVGQSTVRVGVEHAVTEQPKRGIKAGTFRKNATHLKIAVQLLKTRLVRSVRVRVGIHAVRIVSGAVGPMGADGTVF
ncbi:hypothetical protein SDC9_161430 [bioreactor metagenome]|uniref:Uncharacterized protein n=1 Tax=bioreactor metagenome TaxID=1076179 RepID=A0A645FPD7_9ZZZZ